MTIWPEVVAEPSVQVRDARLERTRDGVWIVQSGVPREVALPVDFYLAEPEEVDLRDPEALADFVASWGRFSDPRMRDLGTDFYVFEEHIRGWGVREGWLPDQRDRLLGGLRDYAGDGLGIPYEQHGDDLICPAEVAYRIQRLRTFAYSAVALARGEPIATWWLHGPDLPDLPSETTAADRFAQALNSALRGFSVTVAFGAGEGPAIPATAFTAACLRIALDIAEEVPYQTCGNEVCRRTFTRQRSRAVSGLHTKGLRYCSRKCGFAQAQRERRARLGREAAG